MKNITLILLIGLLILSCSKNEKEFEGDLYFKLIDIGGFYGADDETIEKFEKSLDSIRLIKTPGKDELEAIQIFDILKSNDLLNSPWINLKTKSDIKKIYLSEEDFRKFEIYDRNELINASKKVSLKIKVRELDGGIYYSEKITELKLVDGKTYWRK